MLGPLVDTDALVAALKRGKLRGAGLDVFDQEPLPEHHPLKELDNVVLAPHAAGLTDTAVFSASLAHVDAFAIGDPVSVVNPEVLGSAAGSPGSSGWVIAPPQRSVSGWGYEIACIQVSESVYP